MQLKRTFLQCKLERFKLLTTVLRLPLQHVDFLTAYSAEGMPVMQEFCDSIQSALEAALTLVHCVLSFHAFIHYGGTSIIVTPPPPLPFIPCHFIVQVSCTLLVLYNGMDIPVNNAYSI